MNEQSHKKEMSAAIRGDFQRLRERGVPVALGPQDDAPPHGEQQAEEAPETPPVEAPVPRRGWLSRLAGR
jgi:hypothetical protein